MIKLLKNNINIKMIERMERSSGPGKDSYWGQVDQCVKIAPGFFIVMTPSHGGAWLSHELLHKMPDTWQETPYSPGPWFEEDADIFLPLFWFQDYILRHGVCDHTIKQIEKGDYFKMGKNCSYHGAAYEDYMRRLDKQETAWPTKEVVECYYNQAEKYFTT